MADVIAKTKTGWGAGRANYMAELIAERLTNTSAPGFSNAAMQWGTDTEPMARSAYELHTGELVDELAFAIHPRIPLSGASPDGLVGDAGLIEIKCPNTATHIETLIGQAIPSKYVTQMSWQMACTGRAWCDFVSFDPRLPEDMRLFVRRLHRDNSLISSLEADVLAFLDELDTKLAQLREAVSATRTTARAA